MDPAISQRMLAKLRESMHIPLLSPLEQARCKSMLVLTAKIDHILYPEWDPCGVHVLEDFDCEAEYHSYLRSAVNAVFNGATIQEVKDLLFDLDQMITLEDRGQFRYEVIAAMVSRYGPYAASNAFVPAVSTATPQAAYRSVLNLVIQTRLDAYEQNWAAVRDTYEQITLLCADHLPDGQELYGACLNNLGQAYCHSRQLQLASDAFAHALTLLTPGAQDDDWNLKVCLNNAINCQEHQGNWTAALPYLSWLHRHYLQHHGPKCPTTHEAQKRLDSALTPNHTHPALGPKYIQIEDDGHAVIRNIFYID
jgi:hypothetical protein